MTTIHLTYKNGFSPVAELEPFVLYVDRAKNMCCGLHTKFDRTAEKQPNGFYWTRSLEFFLNPYRPEEAQRYFLDFDLEAIKTATSEDILIVVNNDFKVVDAEFIFDNYVVVKKWVNDSCYMIQTEPYMEYTDVYIDDVNSDHMRVIRNGKWTRVYPSNEVALDDNTLLVKAYGQLLPNLTILVPSNEVYHYEDLGVDFNLKGNITGVRGDFFTSKKGNKVFRINSNGKHYLLRDDWDRRSKRNMPRNNPNVLHYMHSCTNSHKTGYDYIIVPVDFRNSISIDDL